jgi:O-antigen/teichoic acid export membrane protein
MTATTIVVMLLTQLDKIILTKVLSLEAFGIYTIAATVSMAITKPAHLVFSATLPRFTQLVSLNDFAQLESTYLKSIKLIAWVILPVSGLVILFSDLLFNLYLHGQQDYKSVAELSAILLIGNSLHSLTYMPYALSLAHGWTRYGLNISLAASIFIVPLIFIGAINYGAIGAAYAWLILNIGYLVFSIRYLHKKILPNLYWAFYKSILSPSALFLLFVAFYFLTNNFS